MLGIELFFMMLKNKTYLSFAVSFRKTDLFLTFHQVQVNWLAVLAADVWFVEDELPDIFYIRLHIETTQKWSF